MNQTNQAAIPVKATAPVPRWVKFIQEPRNRNLVLIGTGLTLAIIVGILVRLLLPEPTPPPTVVPAGIIQPTLRPGQIVSQRLVIDWNNVTFQPPTELPYYKETEPLLTADRVTDLASSLGFTSAQQKDTRRADAFLWVAGTRSLSATIPFGPLTFVDNYTPTTTGFTSPNQALTLAQTAAAKIFPTTELGLISAGDVDFMSLNTEKTALVAVEIGQAQFAHAKFGQTINGFAYIPPTTANAVFRVTVNNAGRSRYLEVVGGLGKVEESTPQPLKNFIQMQTNAALIAQRLSFTEGIEEEGAIDTAPQILLKVERIDIVYTTTLGSGVIQPVFRLTGTISGSTFETQQSSYVVPAFVDAVFSPTPAP